MPLKCIERFQDLLFWFIYRFSCCMNLFVLTLICQASWYRFSPVCWKWMAQIPIIFFCPRVHRTGEMDRWRVPRSSPSPVQRYLGWHICCSALFQQQKPGFRSTIRSSSSLLLEIWEHVHFLTINDLTFLHLFLLITVQLQDIDKCTFLVELHLERPYIPRGSDLNTWEVRTLSLSLSLSHTHKHYQLVT